MDSLNQKPSAVVYLDACATTPPSVEVIKCIEDVQRFAWANPSSLHAPGLLAAERLERSRQTIAKSFKANADEVVFTSGATESVHMALMGVARSMQPGRLVISAVEHPAVEAASNQLRREGWQICHWPVDGFGRVKLDHLETLLSPPTSLVSLIWGQSEVGTIQPIKTIGLACRERGIQFHTDATQVLREGLLNWSQLPVDLLSASAHKFQGPKGVGLLLIRPEHSTMLLPLQSGGGQEQGLRAGTEPVALIAGMAKAVEQLYLPIAGCPGSNLNIQERVQNMRDGLNIELQKIAGLRFTGHPNDRLTHHISLLVATADGQPVPARAVVRELARRGVAASSGSACSSGRSQNSHVLEAMQVDAEWLQSGLRFSLGPWLLEKNMEVIPDLLNQAIDAAASSA